jgi:hypothetical protein
MPAQDTPRDPGDSARAPQPPAAPSAAWPVPPRQQPYEQAFRLGFDTLLAGGASEADCRRLGAERRGDAIRLSALDRVLRVELAAREVLVEGEGPARRAWALLALHYLCARDPAVDAREVSFAHFADARTYLGVFTARTVNRFLAGAGRTAETFEGGSERLQGRRLPGPGMGYRFLLLPRVPVAIIRYEGDAELGPGATILYRADAERLLPAEDRVVAVELLLDALGGRSMAQGGGVQHEKRS